MRVNRRPDLGEQASAAVPVLWAELERRAVSHAEFARQLGIDTGRMANLLYGVRLPGRDLAVRLREIVDPVLWSEPLPKGWRLPHVRRMAHKIGRLRSRPAA